MLGAGGDGGLSLGMEMKQFELVDNPNGGFETLEAAAREALIIQMAEGGETAVSVAVNGKFVVWHRR